MGSSAARVKLTIRLHRLLHRLQATLDLGIVGVNLQAGLVRLGGANEIALAVQRGALASPALDPVGLDLRSFLGIGERTVPVLLGGEGGGPVAVQDVVLGLERDGLGEFIAGSGSAEFCPGQQWHVGTWRDLHGLVEVLRRNGSVALGLELVGGGHGC